jgi:hypothetical protein
MRKRRRKERRMFTSIRPAWKAGEARKPAEARGAKGRNAEI